VFEAFANPATKRRWFAEGDGWEVFEFTLDFRTGGTETSRFSFQGGPEVRNDTQFQDVSPNRRIVLPYRMTMGEKLLSVCLATVELTPVGSGTRLSYTEQGAHFEGGADLAKGHEEGARQLLERLVAAIDGRI
jgi:uncharacterized protein YndB with AHSA1/START domain